MPIWHGIPSVPHRYDNIPRLVAEHNSKNVLKGRNLPPVVVVLCIHITFLRAQVPVCARQSNTQGLFWSYPSVSDIEREYTSHYWIPQAVQLHFHFHGISPHAIYTLPAPFSVFHPLCKHFTTFYHVFHIQLLHWCGILVSQWQL